MITTGGNRKMYSPHAQKQAAIIMYRKQLIQRARELPFEELKKEVGDYESGMYSDDRSFLNRVLDYWCGVDGHRDVQYQFDKAVLDERGR